MGQKSRSKKNRPQSKQPANQQRQVPKQAVPASLAGGSVDAPAFTPPKPLNSKTTVMDIQSAYIREDILRISLLVAAVLVIVAIAYAVGERTSYLSDAGRELSRFLKLQ